MAQECADCPNRAGSGIPYCLLTVVPGPAKRVSEVKACLMQPRGFRKIYLDDGKVLIR